jgi:hypothetical protein
MTTQTITIEVDPQVAAVYNAASLEQRRKYDALLSLRLEEAVGSARSLEEIMGDMSRRAQERGLTPEILNELLRDN